MQRAPGTAPSHPTSRTEPSSAETPRHRASRRRTSLAAPRSRWEAGAAPGPAHGARSGSLGPARRRSGRRKPETRRGPEESSQPRDDATEPLPPTLGGTGMRWETPPCPIGITLAFPTQLRLHPLGSGAQSRRALRSPGAALRALPLAQVTTPSIYPLPGSPGTSPAPPSPPERRRPTLPAELSAPGRRPSAGGERGATPAPSSVPFPGA